VPELLTLVIYDIPDDDLRVKVAKFLLSKGLKRIQRSAFIGPLTSSQRADLIAGLKRLVAGRRANIQVFPLTQASYNQRASIGVELRYDEEDRLIT